LILVVLAPVLGRLPAYAQTQDSQGTENPTPYPTDAIRRLEKRLQVLEETYQRQIRELQEQLIELEEQVVASQEVRQEEDLEALLAEADELTADEQRKEELAAEQRDTFVGRERTQQALNPELSFVGDFSYDWSESDIKNGFVMRGVEIALQAPLDPYTRFKGFLAGHQEPFGFPFQDHEEEGDHEEADHAEEHEHGGEIGVNVEEAYMEWVALPLHTRLQVGKFRQQYGTLNRWHRHALPSVDTPFALQHVFGHEGLVGLGIGLDWQLGKLWATSNSLTLQVTNADNPVAFAGSDWNDPAFLLRHTGFFELGPDSYFDLGLNWTRGPNTKTGNEKTDIYGFDFAYVWEPTNRARYRNLEFRGEYIHTNYDTGDTPSISSDSYYAYLYGRLSRRWIVGLRYDNAELPGFRYEIYDPEDFREGLKDTGWTPFLTYWQSEFVRLRLQYQRIDRDFISSRGPKTDNRLWLQVTFAAGPHKHESY
jgi:TolA-binding protein